MEEAARRRLGQFVRTTKKGRGGGGGASSQTSGGISSLMGSGGAFIPALDMPSIPTFSLLSSRDGHADESASRPTFTPPRPQNNQKSIVGDDEDDEEPSDAPAFGPGGVEAFEVRN